MEAVKQANERGAGRSWVYRTSDPDITQGRCATAYVKEQKGYCCRALWSLGRRVPTLLREYRALRALTAIGVPVPRVIRFDWSGDEARLVLAGVDGALPLGEALRCFPDQAENILLRVAGVVRHLHESGWNHGALYPDHILIGSAPGHAVTLIDLEKTDRSFFHGADLERLRRYLNLDSPDLARWFEQCYANPAVAPEYRYPRPLA